jgi:anti-sigma factor RsiW
MEPDMTRKPACPDIELLSAWLDDALRADERTALDAHLRSCAACAGVVARMQRLQEAMARLPEVELGVDLAPLVDSRIAPRAPAAQSRGRAQHGLRWWQVALAAPGIAAALGVGVVLGAFAVGGGIAVQAEQVQMAAFSATPPGALCPAPQACQGAPR